MCGVIMATIESCTGWRQSKNSEKPSKQSFIELESRRICTVVTDSTREKYAVSLDFGNKGIAFLKVLNPKEEVVYEVDYDRVAGKDVVTPKAKYAATIGQDLYKQLIEAALTT